MYEICQQYKETKQLCVLKAFCVLVMQFKEEIYLIAWQGQKQLQCDREEDGKIAYTVVGDATQWQESLR